MTSNFTNDQWLTWFSKLKSQPKRKKQQVLNTASLNSIIPKCVVSTCANFHSNVAQLELIKVQNETII